MMAWIFGLPDEPVDRVDVYRRLVGDQASMPAPRQPRHPILAEWTRRRIGTVYLAERMTPCDEVVR